MCLVQVTGHQPAWFASFSWLREHTTAKGKTVLICSWCSEENGKLRILGCKRDSLVKHEMGQPQQLGRQKRRKAAKLGQKFDNMTDEELDEADPARVSARIALDKQRGLDRGFKSRHQKLVEEVKARAAAAASQGSAAGPVPGADLPPSLNMHEALISRHMSLCSGCLFLWLLDILLCLCLGCGWAYVGWVSGPVLGAVLPPGEPIALSHLAHAGHLCLQHHLTT